MGTRERLHAAERTKAARRRHARPPRPPPRYTRAMRLPAMFLLILTPACSTSPASRLVGAWEVDDTEFMRVLVENHSGPRADAPWAWLGYKESAPLESDRISTAGGGCEPAEPTPTIESFHADGTYARDDGRVQPLAGTWRIAHSDGDTVIVAIDTGEDRCESFRTYYFESPDTVRELGGFFNGLFRMRRVTQ